MESAGHLLGYDPRLHGLRERGRERFLARLATRIGRYLQTITSLGIPIVYRIPPRPGRAPDRMLVGPYVAPLGIGGRRRRRSRPRLARRWPRSTGVPFDVARDWMIANNGFVDLRPVRPGERRPRARPGPRRPGAALRHRRTSSPPGSTPSRSARTSPPAASRPSSFAFGRLYERLRQRKIQLGTRETWKHLFRQDAEGRHLISPGLVETVRMYAEGLGKVTGTEALWPRWGY